MVGYIYLVTDTTNGMKYTGQHHYHIEGQLDPNYHGSGTIISKIYKKRPETLKEEYIKTCYSEEEMNSDEQHYIEVFDTLWPNGYNLTKGGDGVLPSEETRIKMSKSHKGKIPPNKGIPMNEEQKKKLSESLKGRNVWNKGIPMSEEQKKKLSEINKGQIPPNKGKHHTEESKRKMSKSHKGIQAGEKHPMFGKHHSEESKKKMSENRSGKCIGEKHPMFGKHHTEESKKKISEKQKGKKLSEETRRKMSKARINGKQSKKVLQYTLDGEFVREWPSIQECERNGYAGANICRCCQGKRKSAYGFKWCYAEE